MSSFMFDYCDGLLCFQFKTITWLNSEVTFPFASNVRNLDFNMPLLVPQDIKVLGSYQLNTVILETFNVDLMLVMPKVGDSVHYWLLLIQFFVMLINRVFILHIYKIVVILNF